MSRSSGRRIGSRKVRSRLKTRTMKTPSGFVIARMIKKKSRICNHPLIVIVVRSWAAEYNRVDCRPAGCSSKFFRAQKRDDEINEQQRGDREAHEGFEIHLHTPIAVFHTHARKRMRAGRRRLLSR